MTRIHRSAIVAAVALSACSGDPTASLRGGPFRAQVNPSDMFIIGGETRAVEITLQDEQLNPLSSAITVTSSNTSVFTIAPEGGTPYNGVRRRYIVTGGNLGRANIQVQSGSFMAPSAAVSVLPTEFDGSASVATAAGGAQITINTSVLKFDPARVQVSFAGVPGLVVSATADAANVLVPFGDPGTLSFDGVAVAYVPGLVVSLESDIAFTQSGDAWTGDDDIATAPSLPLPAGSGENAYALTNTTTVDNSATCPEVVLGFGSSGPCMIYAFTLADDTELVFHVDWDGDADVDIYVCPDADPNNCFEDGGAGATGAHPEETDATVYTAGTHYLYIEVYDGDGPANIYITISQP